ncbi:hypothetical protein [Pedobacter arcticus]|uniref:hypothetical protein n=1 Tax=Pedobacter arcticus TaxID=752140 RepID=UPI00037B3381|nr:hypothetical protein [Pedobacter arcticus]
MSFANLLGVETEFIAVEADIIAVHGREWKPIEALPTYILGTIDLAIDYKKRRLLTNSMIFDYIGQIKQFLKCNASIAYFTPDIKVEVLKIKYLPCAFLGKCPYEGTLCSTVKTKSGEYLTKSKLSIGS